MARESAGRRQRPYGRRTPGTPPPLPPGLADGQPPPTTLELLRALASGPRGLVEADAEERLRRGGENAATGAHGPYGLHGPHGSPPWPRRLARSLRDPFTAVLLCLGAVSAVISSWGAACVIAVLVTVSCVLRCVGEHRADRSTAALRALVPATATVRRRASADAEPVTREIPVDELAPGDVVRLGPGDLVPADLRLLTATGLTVHQAALTGESVPVAKHPVDRPAHPPSDGTETGPGARSGGGPAVDPFAQPQSCFQGSSVVSGSGSAVVVATGGETRFAGAYAGPGPERRRTGGAFERSVRAVAWLLVRFMLLVPPLVLTADAVLRGRGPEVLPFAVAVAVGLTPEMLPVVVTTVLARGAARLARGGEVIVKRLPALHDLGAVDVVCTDKTGTLTRNRPVLDRTLAPGGGPSPEALRWATANSLWTLQLAELPSPDALDEALLDAARDAAAGTGADAGAGADADVGTDGGTDDGTAHEGYEGVAAVPFDPVRRVSCAVLRPTSRLAPAASPATAVRGGGPLGNVHTLVVKGAVEDVLERCTRVRAPGAHGAEPEGAEPEGAEPGRAEPGEDEVPLDDGAREKLHDRAAQLTGDGLRLLAVAIAERPPAQRPYTAADERDLTFVGFVALRDALAPGAGDALARLADRGVAVKVLTGDHPGTAARVCRDLGLPSEGPVTGHEIDALDDRALAELAARATVFARCGPEHKARVVSALRTSGKVTGYLGDGVNDLPALHGADVRICPREATPVAREAADVILAEKDLTVIDRAIARGRHSGATIASYLRIALSSNLGNVVAMLASGLLLPFLPMLPAQVLAQNLCFDAAQLAFAFDPPPDAGAAGRPTALRPRGLLRFIAGFGLLNAAADLATFAVLACTVPGSVHDGGQTAFHAGWFTENLLTQAMVMVLLRRGRRADRGSGRATGVPRFAGPVGWAAAGLAAAGLLLPLSPLAPALGMRALPALYYVPLATVLALYGAGLAAVRRRGRRPERACS